MYLSFRNALTNDAIRLTEIAFAAKQTWNYPEEYMAIWRDELTITEDYIQQNVVIIAEIEEKVVGFVTLVYLPVDKMFGQVFVKSGYWLDHFFIDPDFQHRGIGKQLIREIENYCSEEGITILQIFVDPYATGFYEKMGAQFVNNSPSSIVGREIPIYRFKIIH